MAKLSTPSHPCEQLVRSGPQLEHLHACGRSAYSRRSGKWTCAEHHHLLKLQGTEQPALFSTED